MSNDPLDAVFVTGDEAAALKRADMARKLAMYLERMPVELRGMFTEEFQHIKRAELAQLRADLQAAQARIAQQAAQLEQARNIIATVSLEAFSTNGSEYLCMKKYVREICDAWLSANAQPQEQSA